MKNRIALIVCKLFYKVPEYCFYLWKEGRRKQKQYVKSFAWIKKQVALICKKGHIEIESHGIKNIPTDSGALFIANHQGMFDGLVFFLTSPLPFCFAVKVEAKNLPLIKNLIKTTGSLPIDRGDIKQSLQVINKAADMVREGRGFLIFPEGTRSRMGNQMNEFKSGTFKIATKSKGPIVPVALINSYKPFDSGSVEPVKVYQYYLPPVFYKEYKQMKTVEIAALVKGRIEQAMEEHFIIHPEDRPE